MVVSLDLVRVDLEQATASVVVLLVSLAHLFERLVLATHANLPAIRNILRFSKQLLVSLLHLVG